MNRLKEEIYHFVDNKCIHLQYNQFFSIPLGFSNEFIEKYPLMSLCYYIFSKQYNDDIYIVMDFVKHGHTYLIEYNINWGILQIILQKSNI